MILQARVWAEVAMNEAIEFDTIVINNQHNSGNPTNLGVRNTVITVSTDAITDTTYGATVPNGTVLFDGEVDEHVLLDQIGNFIIAI